MTARQVRPGPSYNGYTWLERNRISVHYKQRKLEGFSFVADACEICGDPDLPPDSWHSEDYSPPYLLAAPATYAVCKACHNRIHKRFNAPDEWRLYLLHLLAGGFGREFVQLHSLPQRRIWQGQIGQGYGVSMAPIRPRQSGPHWWEELTLDPESLVAAWARPRPLRSRPSADAYRAALVVLKASELDLSLLCFHAIQPKRVVTMRGVSRGVLGSYRASTASLIYGSLARRLSVQLNWLPDLRSDGSPIWMTAIAEGWQPEQREFEWVMVPQLAVLMAGYTNGIQSPLSA